MNYELLCNKVIAIARLTGNFIRKESLSFDDAKIEYKGLNDLVSYVDKTAERQLVKNLKKVLPEAGFITEEDETENTYNQPFTWIIDPLTVLLTSFTAFRRFPSALRFMKVWSQYWGGV